LLHGSTSPEALAANNWSEFHRQNMARFNPYENVLNVNNVGGLQQKWRYSTGTEVFSSPAAANGVVYAGSENSTFYALKASNGHQLWSYRTGGQVQCSPAVANGTVYFDSFDGNVYALRARTGVKVWSYATGGSGNNSSPTVVNGVVYIGGGNSDPNVYALDAATVPCCGVTRPVEQ
jgi:outer membrane protein assembly factor BamB